MLGSPKGITPGVAEFTVFGKTVINQYRYRENELPKKQT
jgi:hypothetical protein